MIAIQQWVRGWLWRRRLWVICIRAAQRVVAGSAPDGGARVPRAARVQFAQVCLPPPCPLSLSASLLLCMCVIAHV